MAEKRVHKGGVTLRADEDGKQRIVGYALTYYREDDPDTEYKMGERIVERMMPGCADGVLSEDGLDCVALFNHDSNHVLGRSTSGTLRLSVDDVGLRYEIDPPESRQDILELIERGDVAGSSFAFFIDDEDRIEDREQNRVIYQVNKITRLMDVGPVTYPAYKATSTAIRSENGRSDSINYKPLGADKFIEIVAQRNPKD
jgi:uncharacterized protein